MNYLKKAWNTIIEQPTKKKQDMSCIDDLLEDVMATMMKDGGVNLQGAIIYRNEVYEVNYEKKNTTVTRDQIETAEKILSDFTVHGFSDTLQKVFGDKESLILTEKEKYMLFSLEKPLSKEIINQPYRDDILWFVSEMEKERYQTNCLHLSPYCLEIMDGIEEGFDRYLKDHKIIIETSDFQELQQEIEKDFHDFLFKKTGHNPDGDYGQAYFKEGLHTKEFLSPELIETLENVWTMNFGFGEDSIYPSLLLDEFCNENAGKVYPILVCSKNTDMEYYERIGLMDIDIDDIYMAFKQGTYEEDKIQFKEEEEEELLLS